MLRVKRPSVAPQFLQSHQVVEERRRIFNYLRRDSSERRQRRDEVNEDFFFDRELLNPLGEAFKDKCAFCEMCLEGAGNTLHMRPLRYIADFDEDYREYYLWLAFEWRNLFYACDVCIEKKGSRFPLNSKPGNFLASYDEIVRYERSLLIDPTSEDPHKHLYYTGSGNVLPLTRKGASTIETFDLDRIKLTEERSKCIKHVLFMLRGEPSSYIEEALNIYAPFAGAVRNILRRIVAYWRPQGQATLGSGEVFIRRFIEAWFHSTSVEIERLRLAIGEAELGVRDPSPFYDSSIVSIDHIREPELTDHAGELAKINIINFKAIENLTIALPRRRTEKSGSPALMILGENSTGKSSVLAAIALAAIGAREASKLKRYLPSLCHSPVSSRLDQLDERDVFVEMEFHHNERRAVFAYTPHLINPQGAREPALKVLGYGPRRFFDMNKRSRKIGAAARIQTLFDPLATIPYPGDWLRVQTGDRFYTIAAALRVVLALGDEDELIIEPDHLAVRANGRVTPIDALSEGYRSVFVMTVDIIRELIDEWNHLEQAQALVLIDELETHLHPRWKMQVMTSLRKVFPRVQFIVTTHDPLCLRGMDDGEVMVLQRDPAGRIYALDGLPSVKGMTAEQLLTSDYFGLASTTDATTEIDLASLAGDVARRSASGGINVLPASATTELVSRLTIGDSPTEQIVQDALAQYLERREGQRHLRPQLRVEAVEAVLRALTDDEN